MVATVLIASAAIRVFGRPVNLALTSKRFYRTVMLRWRSFGAWTMAGETPTTVGNALASMAPSFVTGGIRFESTEVAPGMTIPSQVLSDNVQIQGIVKAASPACIFDLWLRPTQFADYAATGASIVAAMRSVYSQGVQFDAWSFDNMSALSAATQRAIFDEARAEGKLVGGGPEPSPIGAPFDYLMLNDTVFQPPSSAVAQKGIPRLLGLANGPTPVDLGGNTEHSDWNFVMQETTPVTITFVVNGLPQAVTVSRSSVVDALARGQAPLGYGLCYPVGWPGGTVTPPTYYTSWTDGSMLQRMQALAARFNPPPR